MFRQALLVASVAGLLAACQTTPKQTVLDLDTTDPLWLTEACVNARKTVHGYDDKETVRAAAGVAGAVAGGPIAGATAGLAMNALQDGKRAELNDEVKAACVSAPGTRRPAFADAPSATPAAPPPPELGAPVATPTDTAIAEPAALAVPDPARPATPAEPRP